MIFVIDFRRFETSKNPSLYRKNDFQKNWKSLLQCEFDDFDDFLWKKHFFVKKQSFWRNPLRGVKIKVLKTSISWISLKLKITKSWIDFLGANDIFFAKTRGGNENVTQSVPPLLRIYHIDQKFCVLSISGTFRAIWAL